MAMSAGKAQRLPKVAPLSSMAYGKRNEGDWKSTLKLFVEEVSRLKEETDALKSTRNDIEASWQKAVEKMKILTDENCLSQHALESLLDEERKKSLAVVKEKEDLLVKLKCADEKCAAKEKEVRRLADMVETEKIRHSVSVALHEKTMEKKESQYRAELHLQEKRLEEMQHELHQQLKRQESELLAKDILLEKERKRWRNWHEGYENENSSDMPQIKGASCACRLSPEATMNFADISSSTPFMAHVPFSVPPDDDDARNVSKKSRLEAARQQLRRINGKSKEDVTLISLSKLNHLQEHFRH
ncbi:hypothetical protein C3747_74g58 [Trypanosoma cruzi]|uniref:Uncharacterized protein n=2 Tax=Trypanosoma cruzi TaxID=5693 RepID=Q4D1W1_TRYCC|nr:hypothetical protein, conserved [Trypanosoma cruzi]EAN86510.1 hypothetical protein, conserved [Trypanosoma cruzi]PWV09829.1 hypothetical protein C3747_74g58 [Trypanosoma cruzi]|eukprot:XP_808361.1 hypothetical protein [Trypanosoma cruzi strain CL Brener]